MQTDLKTMNFQLETIIHPVTHRPVVCYKSLYTNLYETLLATAERLPEKVAVVDDNGSVTWRELCRKVDDLSAVLYHDHGVRPGDRVGLFIMNSIEFCVVFYAVVKLGAIAVILNTKIAPSQLEWMLNRTGARILFSDSDWANKICPVIQNTDVRTIVFTRPCDMLADGVAVAEFNSMLAAANGRRQAFYPNIFAPALIMFTSGTTGVSKGALISHFNVLQNVLSYADILKLDETDCTVIGVPMFHITGLSCLMALFVYLGGKMVLVPKFKAERVVELMREHQATHFHAVPSIFTMLFNAQPDNAPLTSLKSVACGGGAIAAETVRRFCGKNPSVAFHCAYGMTETAGAGVLFPTHYFDVNKPASAGIVVPNTEIHILDKNMNEVPVGVVGEICIGGSTVIDHYWGCDPAVGFIDGLLQSGDLGKFDEDGYIYIVDRKKDMINRSGEKIFSILVEKEIYDLPEVDLCAVFPVYDETHGEVGAAVVTLRPGKTLEPEQIRTHLLGRLAKYEVPKYIEIVDEIPLTPNNKISKYKLREAFEAKYHLMKEKLK